MRRPATLALRFVVLAAIVTTLAMVFAPSPASNSPYLSALSVSGLGTPVLAASCHTHCNFSTNTCVMAHCGMPNCGQKCAFSGGTCIDKPCG